MAVMICHFISIFLGTNRTLWNKINVVCVALDELVGQFSLIQAFSRHALGVRVDSLYCENSNTSPNPKNTTNNNPKSKY